MTNLITIELCAEDRARLDRLTEALETLNGKPMGIAVDSTALCKLADGAIVAEPTPEIEAKGKEPTIDTPKEETPKNEPVEATEPLVEEQIIVSKEEIRQLVFALIRAGKKAKAQAVINQFAPSITDLPDANCNEVYSLLQAVMGE